MLVLVLAQNGMFYAFYAPRVQRQTHVRVHTSPETSFDSGHYPQKTHFEWCTAQKLARTNFRVVPNCARGCGVCIFSSNSLASEASVLAYGQPARFARGLDKTSSVPMCCALPLGFTLYPAPLSLLQSWEKSIFYYFKVGQKHIDKNNIMQLIEWL